MDVPGDAEAWTSRSPADTERLGETLAQALEVGDVIALSGPLGAGKSRLVFGLARGLGCKSPVRSPTFTLVNQYSGRLTLFHADLYRLDPAEVPALALGENLDTGALAVEWGERLDRALAADALRIDFEMGDGDVRRLRGSAPPTPRGRALLLAWRAAIGAPAGGPS